MSDHDEECTLAKLKEKEYERGYERAKAAFTNVIANLEDQLKEVRSALATSRFENGKKERDLNAALNGARVRVCFAGVTRDREGVEKRFINLDFEDNAGKAEYLRVSATDLQITVSGEDHERW